MIDLDPFESSLRPTLDEKKLAKFDSCMRNARILFSDPNADISSPVFITSLFGSRPSSVVGQSLFYYRMEFIVPLYKWLYDGGLVTKETKEFVENLSYGHLSNDIQLRTVYFRSLQDVVNYVGFVGRQNGFDRQDDLLFEKAMVIFYWAGISLIDISVMKKKDVLTDENAVVVNGKKISIDAPAFTIIKKLVDLNEYFAFSKHIKRRLVPSDYLMRSPRAERRDDKAVADIVRRFNAEASQYGKYLDANSLRRNNLFCHLRTMAAEGVVVGSELLNPDYRALYRQWLKMYYPEEVE